VTDAARDFAARLFRLDDEPDEPAAPAVEPRAPFVPNEGCVLAPPVDPDAELRRFVNDLFGYPAD